MSYAIIYSGFIGDLERSLKNLDDIVPDNYTIFIVTEDFSINKITNKFNERIDIMSYTKDKLSKIKNYGDCLEWRKDNDLFIEYKKREEEFIDKTRNYCPEFKSKSSVLYDRIKNKISDHGCKNLLLQTYQYYLGLYL